jgi:hypothetical protein
MKKFNCPACGAEITFRSNISVYSVCNYCSSMVVRHDVDVETIDTMAALPDDMSPLKIGTAGVYRGIGFQLIGRLKIAWKQGTWNEWFMLSENGLAEAQGSYALSHEYTEPLLSDTQAAITKLIAVNNSQKVKINAADLSALSSQNQTIGTYLLLNNQKFKVVDIKQAVCIGSEGELPMTAPKSRRPTTIDLLGELGEFASVEVTHEGGQIFLGHYVDWNELRFQNTRELEGW